MHETNVVPRTIRRNDPATKNLTTKFRPDGNTFHYSDYNFNAQKSYKEARWPCCSGTLPQVAADYRINSYFFDAHNLYVNLFVLSSVRWTAQ